MKDLNILHSMGDQPTTRRLGEEEHLDDVEEAQYGEAVHQGAD